MIKHGGVELHLSLLVMSQYKPDVAALHSFIEFPQTQVALFAATISVCADWDFAALVLTRLTITFVSSVAVQAKRIPTAAGSDIGDEPVLIRTVGERNRTRTGTDCSFRSSVYSPALGSATNDNSRSNTPLDPN